jgi:hypothetical protein
MRKIGLIVFMLLIPAAAVRAQGTPAASMNANLFYGTGVTEGGTTFHFGGGAEFLHKGAGLNAELGMLSFYAKTSAYVGVLSLNGVYHVLDGSGTGRLSPFVTGGYTLYFRSGHANLLNIGGGVDYWARRRVGLRVEFRDHLHFHDVFGTQHSWGLRGGIVLR